MEAQGGDQVASDRRPEQLLERIQDLTDRVDELADVRARTLAQELVAAVIAMYGDGLAPDHGRRRGVQRGGRDDPR